MEAWSSLGKQKGLCGFVWLAAGRFRFLMGRGILFGGWGGVRLGSKLWIRATLPKNHEQLPRVLSCILKSQIPPLLVGQGANTTRMFAFQWAVLDVVSCNQLRAKSAPSAYTRCEAKVSDDGDVFDTVYTVQASPGWALWLAPSGVRQRVWALGKQQGCLKLHSKNEIKCQVFFLAE